MVMVSILLGLLSWSLGICAIKEKSALCGYFSFTACGGSLLAALLIAGRWARQEDAAALMDVMPTAAVCGCVLLAVTVLLNLAALLRAKERP